MDSVGVVSDFIDAAESAYMTGNDEIFYDKLEDPRCQDRQERVWQVYLKATRDVHGESKIDSILAKWKINPNIHPLTGKMVLQIEKTASILKVEDIRRRVLEGALSELSDQEIHSIFMACHSPASSHLFHTSSPLASVPGEITALFWHNRPLMDVEIAQACMEMLKLRSEEASDEFIAKVLVARELEIGTIIPYYHNKEGLIFYYVHESIITGEGMVAYALKPLSKKNHASPLLVFRGTQFYPSSLDMISTFINDCEGHIGESGYLSGKGKIAKLFKDPHFCSTSQRVKILGFSLGGAFAQRTMVEFPEYVQEAVLFSALGVEEHLVRRYAAWVNTHPDHQVKIAHYRIAGDFCDFLGEALVGLGIEHPPYEEGSSREEHQVTLPFRVSLTYIHPYSCLNIPAYGGHAHTSRFFSGYHEYFDLEMITLSRRLEQHLCNANRGGFVRVCQMARDYLGPYALCPLLKGVRFLSRSLFSWRGQEEEQEQKSVISSFAIVKSIYNSI